MKIGTILKRQRFILRIISRSGGRIERLKMMKLAFLFAQEIYPDGFYQFVPYKFGPFSFTLYNELDRLASKEIIDDSDEKKIFLKRNIPSRFFEIDKKLENAFEIFWSKYSGYDTEDIIDYVYEQYPWFTVHCSKKERRAAEIPKADCSIYTAGYEKLHVDGFLNLLLEKGIANIIDVRSNPLSRVYGFHKSTMSRISSYLGFNYYHYPELGIPSNMRKNLDDYNDYLLLFKRYRSEVLVKNRIAIRDLAKIVVEKPSVLMCQEADPEYCHRSQLAQELSEITNLDTIDLRREHEPITIN